MLAEGNYKNGKKEGLWKEYHSTYLLHTIIYIYQRLNTLYSKGNYKNGKKEGLWEYYFPSYDIGILFIPIIMGKGSSLKLKGNYKNGEKEGLWKVYGKGELNYKNGKRIDNGK